MKQTTLSGWLSSKAKGPPPSLPPPAFPRLPTELVALIIEEIEDLSDVRTMLGVSRSFKEVSLGVEKENKLSSFVEADLFLLLLFFLCVARCSTARHTQSVP